MNLLRQTIINGNFRQTRNDSTWSDFSSELNFDVSKSFSLKYCSTDSKERIDKVVGIFGMNIQSAPVNTASCKIEIPGGQSKKTISYDFFTDDSKEAIFFLH